MTAPGSSSIDTSPPGPRVNKRVEGPELEKGAERAPKHARRVQASREDEEDNETCRDAEEDSDDKDADLDEEAEFGQDEWTVVLDKQTRNMLPDYEPPDYDGVPDAALQKHFEWRRERVKADILSTKCANTHDHWTQVKREWRSFCDANFDGDEDIHSDKVMHFLEQVVLSRPRETGQRLEALKASRPCWTAPVKKYMSGINNLWLEQGAKGSVPMSPNVERLIEAHEAELGKKFRESRAEIGTGMFLDGLHNLNEYKKLAAQGLQRGGIEGTRDRAMMLLAHAAMLRGRDARELELSYCHLLPLRDEGFSECNVMTFPLSEGSKDEYGNARMMGVMRHTDVEICPLGAMALYWFERFHVEKQHLPLADPASPHFPNMSNSPNWYDLKVFIRHETDKALPASNPIDPITVRAHAAAMKRMHRVVGVPFSNVVHLGKSSGARLAELRSATDDQFRQVGEGWRGIDIPLPAIRALAGCDRARGEYYIPRLQVAVPDDLANQIFPEADAWLDRVTNGTDGAARNLGAQGWLKLLVYMRKVLLQDSIELRNKYPRHPIWQHAPFDTISYARWLEAAKESLIQASIDTPERQRSKYLLSDIHSVLLASQEALAPINAMILSETKAHLSMMQQMIHASIQQGHLLEQLMQQSSQNMQRSSQMTDQMMRQTQHMPHDAAAGSPPAAHCDLGSSQPAKH